MNRLKKRGVSNNFLENNTKLRVGIILNNFYLEAWKYNILEAITKSDYASLELGIIHKNRDDTTKYFDKPLSNWKTLFYVLYTNLEKRIIQCNPDALAPVDTRNFLKNIPNIEIQPKNDLYYEYVEEDIKKIKEFDLDVIIQCGFGILKGDILNAAKYGIWSYRQSDETRVKGGPPGFWETFERMGERGVTLQILAEDFEDGIVLYHSYFSCDSHIVSLNNNRCYLTSSFFVPRTLKKLNNIGDEVFFNTLERENKKVKFYNYPVYSVPTNLPFLKMLIKQFYRIGADTIKYNFFPYKWFLLYDMNDKISTSFSRFKKIIPPKDRFWADPHVFFKDDIYYIFVEEYLFRQKKGHISLIEMQQSGKYSDPIKVLEEPFHMSYPNIFENNGTLFMIPETQQAQSINLYECTDFPTKWKHRETLFDSVEAVDSTILFHKNKWWLFTNIVEPRGTENYNELSLFYSDNPLSRDWHCHPLNPIISDIKTARSAGRIFKQNDILYRPSQCCNPYYGYGIKINEIISLTEKEYQEKEIAFIEPKWEKKLKGTHTFCYENRLTLIDTFV
jgi:hypothetical protein